MRIFIIIGLVSLCQGDQLSNLISFVSGGPNPVASKAGAGVSPGGGPATGLSAPAPGLPSSVPRLGGSAPRLGGPSRGVQRTSSRVSSLPVISPVPFSELADPSRGRVQIDVPQPAPTSTQSIGARTAGQVRQASSPPPFPGLPSGATQVGGRPVSLSARKRNRPVPLSQVDAPVFLSETFRSPLNDVDPVFVSVQEPAEALSHNFAPGGRPRARPVQRQNLPVIAVLNEPSIQRNFQNNQVNYDRFVQDVFTPTQGGQRYSNQNTQDEGRKQNDLTHQEALERHRQAVLQVEKQQHSFQQPQQQPHQLPLHVQQQLPQQHRPQQQFQQHAHRPQNPLQQPQQQGQTHFSIPGADRQRQYEQELRLAQEALKSLG
eukprot:TRINITY_DN2332_c0_g1_i2.p1 TRINITY_DN2332_c0_g1~~TRINITY_DN2332_c0_g1_i2.p1  ORF type:complete len:391 (-),score=88.74 TRINITY_DN2332_c0_g1_i2:109-1233(-)